MLPNYKCKNFPLDFVQLISNTTTNSLQSEHYSVFPLQQFRKGSNSFRSRNNWHWKQIQKIMGIQPCFLPPESYRRHCYSIQQASQTMLFLHKATSYYYCSLYLRRPMISQPLLDDQWKSSVFSFLFVSIKFALTLLALSLLGTHSVTVLESWHCFFL